MPPWISWSASIKVNCTGKYSPTKGWSGGAWLNAREKAMVRIVRRVLG